MCASDRPQRSPSPIGSLSVIGAEVAFLNFTGIGPQTVAEQLVSEQDRGAMFAPL